MIYNVHAGHAAVGKGAIGAVGLISESVEDRIVKDKVISKLKSLEHTVYDCTVDSGTQSGVLSAIVKKCNSHNVDLDISIHFNSGVNRPSKDGKTTGTEVYIYDYTKKISADAAQGICNAISSLGYKNRGVKTSKSLYVLSKTKAPALLIECCFVDDGDDVALYNAENMANAIVYGITGMKTSDMPVQKSTQTTQTKKKEFQVKLKTNLNIRKDPSMSGQIVGLAKKKITYTIVDTSGGWGKLKSGAGWISINTKYVTYL